MFVKTPYQTPVMRIGVVSFEHNFLTSATAGGITPGQDPGPGGSWDFGEDD